MIEAKFQNIISCVDFEVDGLTYDRKGFAEGYQYDEIEYINSDNLRYRIHTIEDIECSSDPKDNTVKAIVTIVGHANVTLKCSYFNEEKSAWDSDSHEYVWKAYETIEETQDFSFPVRLTITGNCDRRLNIEDYQLLLSDDFAQLNHSTLVERNNIVDYDDFDAGFHVEKVLSCPCCGNDIKVDLISDSTDCVSSSERQMGIEKEYNINVVDYCPHCNKEYQITGSIWEYPENCCNYEQNIKISTNNCYTLV